VEDNLPGILDGIDEPVTVEQLEEVVRRAGQRRQATLIAGAAALLALGALGGAIARLPSNDQTLGFAGRDEAATNQSARGWATDMPLGGTVETYMPLFRRESNGVAVRAYRLAIPPPPAGVDPACAGPSSFVQAELSTAAAVGLLFAPELAEAKPQGTELRVLAADSFGVSEGAPATTAVVRTGPGVATVRITTPSGSDTMAPEDGIAVLAVAGLADGGRVEGLAPDGAVVATQPIIPPPPSEDEIITRKEIDGKACSASSCGLVPSGRAELPVPPVTTIVGSGATGQIADPGPDHIEIDPACGKVINGEGGVISGPATAIPPSKSGGTAVAPGQPGATTTAPALARRYSPGVGSVGAAGSTTTVASPTSTAAPSAAP